MISKWEEFAVASLLKYTHIFAHPIIVLILLYSKEIARTLSDISVVELFFFACCTPLCFEYLLMAETALGLILTFLLFIYFSYFLLTSLREKQNLKLLSKCFVFPHCITFHMMEMDMFFLIIYLR